ncbi:MAG: lysylphosphatidylglycerol synthase transmembrane domain-containing protein [Balneolaceae bacterium]
MNKFLKILLSVAFAALFLWLAFRNVEFSEILEASKEMSWGWIFPFTISLISAHYIRAERWRMLFNDGGVIPHRFTLFTGVMFGYLTNIPFPRLGEITRPIYVARQVGESNSKIIGTIVLERIVDVVSMLMIMTFVGFFMISDPEILSRLFKIDFTDPSIVTALIKGAIKYGLIVIGIGILLFFLLRKLSEGEGKFPSFVNKIKDTGKSFFKGVLAIRTLKNWPLFIVYTALIWLLYILMIYIPFWMFDLQTTFDLSFADAVVLTMVSAVGISIPTPGGVGSYHYFITYSLFVLYAVPEVTGLAFATITHAATLLLVIIIAPTCLAIDKYLILKKEAKE